METNVPFPVDSMSYRELIRHEVEQTILPDQFYANAVNFICQLEEKGNQFLCDLYNRGLEKCEYYRTDDFTLNVLPNKDGGLSAIIITPPPTSPYLCTMIGLYVDRAKCPNYYTIELTTTEDYFLREIRSENTILNFNPGHTISEHIIAMNNICNVILENETGHSSNISKEQDSDTEEIEESILQKEKKIFSEEYQNVINHMTESERTDLTKVIVRLRGYEIFLEELRGDFDSIEELIIDTRARLKADNEGISYSEAKHLLEKFYQMGVYEADVSADPLIAAIKHKSTDIDEHEGIVLVKEYKELFDLGIITEEEFRQKKKELLKL